MIEVRGRGERVIRRDVLIKQHGLNERQAKALGFLILLIKGHSNHFQ